MCACTELSYFLCIPIVCFISAPSMDADFSTVSAVICVLQIAQGPMAMSCRRVKSFKRGRTVQSLLHPDGYIHAHQPLTTQIRL